MLLSSGALVISCISLWPSTPSEAAHVAPHPEAAFEPLLLASDAPTLEGNEHFNLISMLVVTSSCGEQVGRAGSAPRSDSRHRNKEAQGSDL